MTSLPIAKRRQNFHRFTGLIAIAACVFIVQSGTAQTTQAAKADEVKETIRPAIAKPMIAAEKALQEKKYADALQQIVEAEKVDGKTPYEIYLLDRMRASDAIGAGNDTLAV